MRAPTGLIEVVSMFKRSLTSQPRAVAKARARRRWLRERRLVRVPSSDASSAESSGSELDVPVLALPAPSADEPSHSEPGGDVVMES